MKLLVLLPVLLLTACSPAPEAPSELGDLTIYLFEGFSGDESEVLAGLENLAPILQHDFDYDADWSERQFKQPVLTEDHLGGAAKPPSFDPSLQKAVSLAFRSRHPVSAHVGGTLLADQEPLEPNASRHDRTFLSDTACWADGSCDSLSTANAIVKANALYTVAYEADKAYRRFVLSDGRSALLARVVQAEVGYAEVGDTHIDQNYTVDAFIEDADDPGQTLRMMMIWTAVTINGDTLASLNIDGVLSGGLENTMLAHDAWYDEHP